MIKHIIFDIGNVLVGFDPDSYIKHFHFDPEKERNIKSTVFGASVWKDLDRSIKPVGQLREELASLARPEYHDDVLRVFDHSCGSVCRLDYAIPWIQDLQTLGFHTWYLSNYSFWMIERTKTALDFLPLMEGGLFSCEVGWGKPEPQIFRAFLARCPQVVPEESVFFDDTPANVEAARALGFHAIVFQNHAQAMRELQALVAQLA